MSLRDLHRAIDRSMPIRKGEEINLQSLQTFLQDHKELGGTLYSEQYHEGTTSLTYKLRCDAKEYVLRVASDKEEYRGAEKIKKEYDLLTLINPHCPYSPRPILFCEDMSILGQPFFVMEKVEGVILRKKPPTNIALSSDVMSKLSQRSLDILIEIHSIEYNKIDWATSSLTKLDLNTHLKEMQHLFEQSKVLPVPELDVISDWLSQHLPSPPNDRFVHMDYKYENFVLQHDQPDEVLAVLDWESATVGNYMLDLAIMLVQWPELMDPPPIKSQGLTWMPGNMNRKQVLAYYEEHSGNAVEGIEYYFVFACFKLAVQLQSRYKIIKNRSGMNTRLISAMNLIKSLAQLGTKAIKDKRISNF